MLNLLKLAQVNTGRTIKYPAWQFMFKTVDG